MRHNNEVEVSIVANATFIFLELMENRVKREKKSKFSHRNARAGNKSVIYMVGPDTGAIIIEDPGEARAGTLLGPDSGHFH